MTHPPVAYGKIGILLINLGTPEAPTAKAVRPYLKEFLSDKRVIEFPAIFWQLILRGIILNTRPRKTAKLYQKIWRTKTNESPLKYYTRKQADALQKQLKKTVTVKWAMRYGAPSIGEKISELKEEGCDRIVLFPLYPQYSATTTASAYDDAFRALMKMRWQPALRTIAPWHDHPDYIAALGKSLSAHLKTLKWQPDAIITSFHGLPQKYFDKGDPYHCHCAKTSRLLRDHMGWPESAWHLGFQSRFGPQKWLQPYAEDIVRDYAQNGKKIAIIMPGFLSDCVETLEEVNIGLREGFIAAGGADFTSIACLNDSAEAINLFAKIIQNELAGWI